MEKETMPAIDHHHGDEAVKWWTIAAAFWFPIFTLFGFLLAIKFFLPTFLTDSFWDSFGRIRPAHTNGVLFGFVTSGLIALMFYILPRLCAVSLRDTKLAKGAAVLWNINILGGIIGILLGQSQGREYAELPFYTDVIVVILLLTLAYIVLDTITHRNEKKLFVSVWYYAATVIMFPLVYFVGNVMWRPATGALNGTIDGIFNWFYGHNVLGLWFTTLGTPAWYYFIVKMTKRPLYSHLLSLVAFFSTVFFYTGVGSHHLLQAPLPEWLKTGAVMMSVLMAVPIIAFATNIFLTVRGSWNKIFSSVPLLFTMFGFSAYILTSLQGSFQALRSTNIFLHFSQWPVGHAHLALLGGFGFLVIGAIYWFLPKITGYRIYNNRLMVYNFWLGAIGFIFFFIAMSIAGLQQNSNWYVHINVVETLPTLKVWFVVRAISGGTVVLSAFVFAINIFLSLMKRGRPYEEELIDEIQPITSELTESIFMRRSQQGINLPIVVMSSLTLFIIMAFMVIAMPYMYTTDQPSANSSPLTDAQERGQLLYKSAGCFYCHNQFVRPTDWAMGRTSESGDFYYSVPNFLGTERTGPSLSQIGGKRPTLWHVDHYKDPRSVSPSSIMPSFSFLTDAEVGDLISYIDNLGTQNLNTQAFQPLVPTEYQNKTNPNVPLMLQVMSSYDPTQGSYTGDPLLGQQWADLFDKGKELYLRKCVSCHGCSGNGQGPYARQVITRPANIHERMINYPVNIDAFHDWRISEGVPGTGMPAWKLSLDQNTIWAINTYEMSFIGGAIRTIDGSISDNAGDQYEADVHPTPLIKGTATDLQKGKEFYELYCAQCHGVSGHGDGPASIATTNGGYIQPQPANFEESGNDFQNYGRWLYKAEEGVETTNMPPWKFALNNTEIAQTIFYIHTFSSVDNYNNKWASLYSDSYARNLKK